MDSMIAAAARALAAGDALTALQRVALRDDPPALALRGIAMAQLGEHPRARARCVVAEAEVALALRDLGGAPRPLLEAADTLQAHGDTANATQARLIAARRLLRIGRLNEAAAAMDALATAPAAGDLPPALRAMTDLTLAEVAQERAVLDQPAARRVGAGVDHSRCACRRWQTCSPLARWRWMRAGAAWGWPRTQPQQTLAPCGNHWHVGPSCLPSPAHWRRPGPAMQSARR